MTIRCAPRALFVLLVAVSGAARADARGVVMKPLGHAYPVREALAWRDGERIRVVLSAQPFDWIGFAADGRLDAKDLVRHRIETGDLGTIELVLDANGYFREWDHDETEDGVNPVGGWKLAALDDAHVAGTFRYATTDVAFDLPIRGAAIAESGTALAAGSEPVRALEAYFAAQRRRDVKGTMALAMAPEEIAGVDAEQEARFAAALEPTPLTVERIEFVSGRGTGSVATVEYKAYAMIPNDRPRRASLARIDGRWIVRDPIVD